MSENIKMKFCRKCGKQINADAAFCRFCSFRFETVQKEEQSSEATVKMKFCRKCGKQINTDAAFCRFCGFRFENLPKKEQSAGASQAENNDAKEKAPDTGQNQQSEMIKTAAVQAAGSIAKIMANSLKNNVQTMASSDPGEVMVGELSNDIINGTIKGKL